MNPKRADLRQHYQKVEAQALQSKQHLDRTAQLSSFENTVIDAFNMLIRFMDGKVTKTEVTNQLKSISTPDVDKVVIALSKLDADVLSTKVDTKPLEDVLKSIKREVSLIPKQQAKFEQKEAVKVTNLSDINFDTSKLEAAIKALDVAPKVDVKAPIINVDKPDLQPLQSVMLDLLKAVQNQKFPEFPDIPPVDFSKAEKKLDQSNKYLKELVDKPIAMGGGGGGGGNGTPYQTPDGKASYVNLNNDGTIPTKDAAAAVLVQQMLDILRTMRDQENIIPYARTINDEMRVVIGSGAINISQIAMWAAGSYSGYYGTGGSNSVDNREEMELQSINNFNQVRSRWTIT